MLTPVCICLVLAVRRKNTEMWLTQFRLGSTTKEQRNPGRKPSKTGLLQEASFRTVPTWATEMGLLSNQYSHQHVSTLKVCRHMSPVARAEAQSRAVGAGPLKAPRAQICTANLQGQNFHPGEARRQGLCPSGPGRQN